MVPNGLKQIWAAGRPAVNGWLSVGNSFTAEIMAAQGYDSLTVDQQHGALDYAALLPMLQAIRSSGVTPMVRVPWLDPGAVMKALDAGAYGIICPMINNREEAERLVSYVRYPPEGTRSYGPTRVIFAAGADYGLRANEEILCFAMIETAEAVANLDAIVATPGLDGVYIGPADLTLGLKGRSLPIGFDRREPEMIAVIRRIAERAHANGIKAALHTGSAAYAADAVGWGFDLVTISNDVRLLAAAAKESTSAFRAAIEGSRPAAPAAPSGAY